MNYAENIKKVRDIVNKMRYLESLDGILYCDKWFTGPRDGFPYLTKVNAYLSELRQQQLLSPEVSQLVAAFEGYAPDQFASDLDRGMVQFLRDRYRMLCVSRAKYKPHWQPPIPEDSWPGKNACVRTTLKHSNRF